MVKIINCLERQNKEGKTFMVLELMGAVELIQSLNSGKFYATSRRASISSTFTEEVAKSLIGSTLPGKIVRVESEEYDFTIPGSDEIIKLAHKYEYQPEAAPYNPMPEKMFSLKRSLQTS
jgi:hypothetical protein